jgi:diguanylate cyclase (GGDEF)-like protein
MLPSPQPLSSLWRLCENGVSRAARGFSLGITARLSGALIAVAVLAAAANFIVSKSALLIRTTALSSGLTTRAPRVLRDISKDTPPFDRMLSDEVLVAIDRFEWTSRRRAENQSMENSAEYLAATNALHTTIVSFDNSFSGANANRVATISRALEDYASRGIAVVRAGDNARNSKQDYAEHVDAMDKRVGASLDRAWHMFGRVIARQSLMKLHTDLESLRQLAQGLNTNAPFGSQKVDASLAALEKVVSNDLSVHPVARVGSQSAQWIRDMREELDALIVTREEISALSRAYATATREFIRNRVALSADIEAATAKAQTRSEAAVNASSNIADVVPSQRFPSSSAVALPHDAMQQSVLIQPDPQARALMATVTGIVMLIIAAICIFTVRSVLVPVRRILQATQRLADGDPQSRVLPGGMRELATLGIAFNDMAERLGVAQEDGRRQQESLETQVLERTHKLKVLAERDPLTSLANRRHLFGRLNDTIDRAAHTGSCVGVYFVDIDNFKNYNDSLGHVFGDRVLMSAANRLEEIIEGEGFVARFGGDEFTVVLEAADGLESVHEFGLRLVCAFHQLLPVDDRELSVSVSVGASAYPMHAQDADGLLRAADSALFRAKELGRSQVVVFTPQLTESAAARFSTEQGLRRALEHGDFELVYQPEVDLATFEMGLVEALLRWRMPDGRLAKPGEFLAIAEQSGAIVDINNWVLKTAVQCAAEWHHGAWPNARVAVNIAPRQILDKRFTDRLLNLLEQFRLPPRCIELELTESALQTGSGTIAALRNLQSRGIGIALDDFGTGYSSLTSLEQLPLSRIKLDRSLIVNVETSPRAAAIAKAILELCAGLQLEVTVEGVERAQQFAWLLGQRSVYLQGYLVSEPVPREEILQIQWSLAQKMQDLLLSANSIPNKDRLSLRDTAPDPRRVDASES